MSLFDHVFLPGIRCIRTIYGLVYKPYATYRDIINHGHLGELIYLSLILAVYFAFASLIKTTAFRPFLLTKQFAVLVSSVGATYLLVIGLIWIIGKRLGGRGELSKVGLAWAYTLIPTVVWFLATSLLYVILPPPRTTAPLGILFSLLFLIFSATLFFWKITLAYLTLRFGLRLDLLRILAVWAISLPIIGVYSFGMYKAGVFKVPFL